MNEQRIVTDTTNSAIAITGFSPADEEAALAFCQQIFADEGWPIEFMGSTIGDDFARPRDVFLLAKQGAAIVGCAALKELTADDALMTRFFVAAAHRGTGLATSLFAALFARARGLGYALVVLDVNRESARAIRFYEKQDMERFIPEPHSRWLESAPDERQYAHYFRKRV